MKDDFVEIQSQVWNIYHAADPLALMKNVATFKTWALLSLPQGTGLDAILKLCAKTPLSSSLMPSQRLTVPVI